jgi:hypothetical protein
MGAPSAFSPRELAVDEARDKDAQLVAVVEVQPGASPKVATADVRDRTGQRLALLSAIAAKSSQCVEDGTAPVPVARDPFEREDVYSPVSEAEPEERQGTADVSPSEGPGHIWYGWQVMLADAGTLLLHYTPAGRFAWVTYVFAPLGVHAVNGQGTRAGLSFGLRLLVPLAAAGLGVLAVSAGICDKDGDRATCGGGLVAGPFIAGMVLAALADSALIAWKVSEEASDHVDTGSARRASGLTVGVGMLPYRGGAGLGVAGRF